MFKSPNHQQKKEPPKTSTPQQNDTKPPAARISYSQRPSPPPVERETFEQFNARITALRNATKPSVTPLNTPLLQRSAITFMSSDGIPFTLPGTTEENLDVFAKAFNVQVYTWIALRGLIDNLMQTEDDSWDKNTLLPYILGELAKKPPPLAESGKEIPKEELDSYNYLNTFMSVLEFSKQNPAVDLESMSAEDMERELQDRGKRKSTTSLEEEEGAKKIRPNVEIKLKAMIAPDENVLFPLLTRELEWKIVSYLTEKDFPSMMRVCKAWLNRVFKELKLQALRLLQTQLPEDQAAEMKDSQSTWDKLKESLGTGLGDYVYMGIIRIALRYQSNQREAKNLPLNSVNYIAQNTIAKVIKALGWRKYSSSLRLDRNEAQITVRGLIEEIQKHAKITSVLEGYAHDPQTYPQEFYSLGKKDVPYLLQEWQKRLAKHWHRLYAKNQPNEKDPIHELDQTATELHDAIYPTPSESQGQNTGTAIENNQLAVYTTSGLGSEQENRVKSKQAQARIATPKTVENSWDAKRGKDRRYFWRGQKPAQTLVKVPISFHPEAQRTEDLEPWQMKYAGNVYHACVQCMALYYSIGLDKGEGYKASHGGKVPSVVPPKVRENSVYLSHYLEGLWDELEPMLLDVEQYLQKVANIKEPAQKNKLAGEQWQLLEKMRRFIQFLDFIERQDTNFYEQAGIKGGPNASATRTVPEEKRTRSNTI